MDDESGDDDSQKFLGKTNTQASYVGVLINIKYTHFHCQALYLDHELKLYKVQVQLDIRKYMFSFGLTEKCNGLPAALLNCNTVEIFKKELTAISRLWDIKKLLLTDDWSS